MKERKEVNKMRLKCISKIKDLQDKKDPKVFYEYGKEYSIADEKRAKELIESGKFELVDTDNDVILDYSNGEPPKVTIGAEATKKIGKKSTK